MARPYSNDLRERAVAAVERDGLSRRQAAARYGVAVSAVIKWVRRWRETKAASPPARWAAIGQRRLPGRGGPGCWTAAGRRSSHCAAWSPSSPNKV